MKNVGGSILGSPLVGADGLPNGIAGFVEAGREAALAAVGGRIGIGLCTIATPRAGARTTSQTTYGLLDRALGGV